MCRSRAPYVWTEGPAKKESEIINSVPRNFGGSTVRPRGRQRDICATLRGAYVACAYRRVPLIYARKSTCDNSPPPLCRPGALPRICITHISSFITVIMSISALCLKYNVTRRCTVDICIATKRAFTPLDSTLEILCSRECIRIGACRDASSDVYAIRLTVFNAHRRRTGSFRRLRRGRWIRGGRRRDL